MTYDPILVTDMPTFEELGFTVEKRWKKDGNPVRVKCEDCAMVLSVLKGEPSEQAMLEWCRHHNAEKH